MKTNSKSILNIFTLFALLASLLGGALTVTPAYAAGIVVNTNADTFDVVGKDCTNVTISDLPGGGDGFISLREAICAANNTAGTDTITFAANYTITLGSQLPAVTTTIIINGNGAANSIVQANAAANTATYRVFEVTSSGNLTLDSLTVRHGVCNGACSTFTDNGGGILNQGTLTVKNSTLSGNSAEYGGCVLNDSGTSTVTNSTLSGNSALSNGGGIYNNFGTMTVTNSTLSGNSADYGGGIYNDGTATVTNSTLSGNSAGIGGGGMFNNSTLNYANTIIANSTSGDDCVNTSTIGTNTNNLVEDNACSPSLSGDPNLGALADNGGATQTHALLSPSIAIDAGNATICANAPVNNLDQRGVTRPIDGNAVPGAVCDIGAYESNAQAAPNFIVNVSDDTNDGSCDAFVAGITDCTLREAINAANTISGTDTITFAANYTITLGSQLPAITTVITINGKGAANSIIQANAAANTATYRVFEVGGGGNLTLDSLTVRHGVCNGACSTLTDYGGGILNQGTLTVTNSTLSGNSANYGGGGGGIGSGGTLTVTNSTLSGNSAEYGGSIYNDGTATVTNSALSGNSATSWGGGILNNYRLTVTNSTLSGNSALILGGGIWNLGTTTVTNSTLSGNSATSFGGGILNFIGTLTVTNSTLSGNSALSQGGGIYNDGTLNYANTLIANSTSGDDCVNTSTIGTNTNNLVEDNSCSPSLSGDPNLGALANNGGVTQTHKLLPPSIAIDAGDATICANAPVNNLDQRGVTRPIDGNTVPGAVCDIGAFEAGPELVFKNGFE